MTTIQMLIHSGHFREIVEEAASNTRAQFPRISIVTIIIATVVGYVWAR